jgi:hypothetical protein
MTLSFAAVIDPVAVATPALAVAALATVALLAVPVPDASPAWAEIDEPAEAALATPAAVAVVGVVATMPDAC